MTETNQVTAQISSHENEAALIGSVLRNSSRFEELSSIVKETDFQWHPYGWAWKAMTYLHDNGMGIDTITLGDELQRSGKLEEFIYSTSDTMRWTGRAALSKIRENGDPRNAETYASKVKDYANKRELTEIYTQGVYWAQNGRTASAILEDITKRMGEIVTFDGKANTHTQTLGEAVGDAYDNTDKASRGELKMVKTGYSDLDYILSGMMGGDLIVVAARPGQGKTALLASISKNVSEKKNNQKTNSTEKGGRVLILTLEMKNSQIAMRFIAMESGISYEKQKTGKLEDREWPLYTQAVEKLSDTELYPIILNDLPSIRPSQIRQEVRKAIVKLGGLDLICIDYIGLAGSDGKYETRALEVSNICKALKGIAKEFDVPVLAAAQLSRAVESRSDKRPMLSDLKESGGIEENADVVMFIYRPDQYEKDSDKQNVAEIIVAKHRNGPVGSCELIYRNTLTRFESATMKKFSPNDHAASYANHASVGSE